MELCDALCADRAALTALWAETFGDPPALIGRFLTLLPELGFGLAAVEDGRLLGAAYWIDALRLEGRRLGYLYAVAVDPTARGRGVGAALNRACIGQGRERGALWCTTEPAEPSLFAWYARVGLHPALSVRRTAHSAAALLPVAPLTARDYGERREALLALTPHVTLLPAALDFEEALLRSFGGGFFAVGQGIAAVEREDGRALVRETLGEDTAAAAASLAAFLGCGRAERQETAEKGETLLAADRPLPHGTQWGLRFD